MPLLNLLRFLSNSYFCPPTRLYFMAESSLHHLDVSSELFALLISEKGKFRPARWFARLPYLPRAAPESVAASL